MKACWADYSISESTLSHREFQQALKSNASLAAHLKSSLAIDDSRSITTLFGQLKLPASSPFVEEGVAAEDKGDPSTFPPSKEGVSQTKGGEDRKLVCAQKAAPSFNEVFSRHSGKIEGRGGTSSWVMRRRQKRHASKSSSGGEAIQERGDQENVEIPLNDKGCTYTSKSSMGGSTEVGGDDVCVASTSSERVASNSPHIQSVMGKEEQQGGGFVSEQGEMVKASVNDVAGGGTAIGEGVAMEGGEESAASHTSSARAFRNASLLGKKAASLLYTQKKLQGFLYDVSPELSNTRTKRRLAVPEEEEDGGEELDWEKNEGSKGPHGSLEDSYPPLVGGGSGNEGRMCAKPVTLRFQDVLEAENYPTHNQAASDEANGVQYEGSNGRIKPPLKGSVWVNSTLLPPPPPQPLHTTTHDGDMPRFSQKSLTERSKLSSSGAEGEAFGVHGATAASPSEDTRNLGGDNLQPLKSPSSLQASSMCVARGVTSASKASTNLHEGFENALGPAPRGTTGRSKKSRRKSKSQTSANSKSEAQNFVHTGSTPSLEPSPSMYPAMMLYQLPAVGISSSNGNGVGGGGGFFTHQAPPTSHFAFTATSMGGGYTPYASSPYSFGGVAPSPQLGGNPQIKPSKDAKKHFKGGGQQQHTWASQQEKSAFTPRTHSDKQEGSSSEQRPHAFLMNPTLFAGGHPMGMPSFNPPQGGGGSPISIPPNTTLNPVFTQMQAFPFCINGVRTPGQEFSEKPQNTHANSEQIAARLGVIKPESSKDSQLCSPPSVSVGGGDSFCHETELDEKRIASRLKDIAIGKFTSGYMNYVKLVPKESRRPSDPSTPNPREKISAAQFHAKCTKWRKSLHKYDDVA